MTKEVNKFDALAYAIQAIGYPNDSDSTRYDWRGADLWDRTSYWCMVGGRMLEIHQWSDGDQSTAGGVGYLADLVVFRDNDDGSLCPYYEEQARALIDAFNEAVK